MTRSALARVAIGAAVVITLVFFALALRNAWDEVDQWPTAPTLLAAGTCWVLSLGAAAIGWAILLGPPDSVRHGAAFLVSQLGKYVPGGIGQFAGQVGLARSSGVPVSRGIVTLGVFAIAQGGAGALSLVALAVIWDGGSAWLRLGAAAAGLVGVAMTLDRRWLLWALGRLKRFNDDPAGLVPGPRPVVVAWLLSAGTLVGGAGAYALILSRLTPVDDVPLAMVAFAAAWTIGFIVVPLPSGLGLRELVLVGVLATIGISGSVVVAASVIHRLVCMLAELVGAACGTVALRILHVGTPFEAASTPDVPST